MEREKALRTIDHFFEMDRYEDAVPYIVNLLEYDPTDSVACNYMAVVHLERGESIQAREMCELALKYGMHEGSVYHLMGLTHNQEKNYLAAEKAYLTALELEPEDGGIFASYSLLMLKTGNEEKALKLLEVAKSLDPGNERVNQVLLLYYFSRNDQKKQLECIQNIMESASSEIQSLMNLGIFHALKKDERTAREYFIKAYLLDPTNSEILEVLKSFDELTHPLFFPQRLIRKVGGFAVIYFTFIVITIILSYMKQYTILLPVAFIYIILCIYTWITPFIYKRYLYG